METKQVDKKTNQYSLRSHAIVIGSGIAGLSAARVLANYFDQVMVIDRDRILGESIFRSGIPQAHHAHTLLPLGQMILEQLFPGFVDQLLDEGAEMVDTEDETFYYERGIWRKPKVPYPTISCSRPKLENLLYRRMSASPQIKILSGYEATELDVEGTDRVRGGQRSQPAVA